MTVQIKPDQLPENLLDDEIPCDGIVYEPVARSCSRAATLRSYGHGCMTSIKCLECWQVWHVAMLKILQQRLIYCRKCCHHFSTVEAFSDYRPF